MARAIDGGDQGMHKETGTAEASGLGSQIRGTNSNKKVMCFRYRESGHETKFCIAKITCLVGGNESHKTVF